MERPLVLVSSTCFDLIDMREELRWHLAERGFRPSLSDIPVSDFEVLPDESSIASCLHNAQQADHIVVILSQRYGPPIGSYGYDAVSATHLEYRAARDAGRPVLFLVRDRLLAEYDIWKKNRDKEVIYRWVRSEHDQQLFLFIDEHAQWSAERGQSNWFDRFGSSYDVKSILDKRLGSYSRKAMAETLISGGSAPVLVPQFPNHRITSKCDFAMDVHNLGSSCAIDVTCEVLVQGTPYRLEVGHVPSLGKIRKNVIFPTPMNLAGGSFEVQFTFAYLTPENLMLGDQWSCTVQVGEIAAEYLGKVTWANASAPEVRVLSG